MDDETKKRFDGVDERFDQVDNRLDGVDKSVDRLQGEMAAGFASLAKLIEDQGASLEREIRNLDREIRTEMRSGFERLDAATARNTKVLTGGSKSVAALIAWSERQDAKELKQDEEIRDLRSRVEKLERRVG